jgi:hypothetical protein
MQSCGLLRAVERPPRHHRAGPSLVISWIIFQQDKLGRIGNDIGATDEIEPGVVIGAVVGRLRSLAGPGVQTTSKSLSGAALGWVNLPTRTPLLPTGAASSFPVVKGVMEYIPRGVKAILKS